jgi:hypothetical protein
MTTDGGSAAVPGSPVNHTYGRPVLIGMGGALVGLLPWLITGARLPLQNLWASGALPADMPFVLLPFSQYAIVTIIGLLVTGAGAAGLAARALRRRLAPRAGVLALVGVLVVQAIAIVESALMTRAGLSERRESALYLSLLVGVAVLALFVGALVVWLVAAAPRAGALLGLSITALAAGPWLSQLIAPLGSVPGDTQLVLLQSVRWVPPVLVGAAIAWARLGSFGRVVAALSGLLLVWVVPALVTGIVNSAGSRVMASDPVGMLEYGVQVFFAALTLAPVVVPELAVTVIVAGVGLGVRAMLGRSRGADVVPEAGASA